MSWQGKRSWMRSPYHEDMRTGFREHLSDMQWQRGILTRDLDSMLIGDREAAISRMLQDAGSEAEPDSKLFGSVVDEDDLLF